MTAVLFDADGVVQHGDDDWEGRLRPVLGAGADVSAFLGEVFSAEEPTLRGHGDFELILDAALVRWGRPGRLHDALSAWEEIAVDYAILQIVAELRARGIYCALATNQNAYRARYMSEHLGYGTTFDRAFYSCAIGFTKPDPRFFRTVLETLRLPPHHVLFIDDREENVAAARACGMEGAVFQPAATEDRSEVMRRVLAVHGLFDG